MQSGMLSNPRLAVIIPAYKTRSHVMKVISEIGPEADRIYVIDDGCPENSGAHVQNHCTDQRVTVLFHTQNEGVGAAVMTGYRAAIDDGMEILVKIDSDGQMDPAIIFDFVDPLTAGEADYAKGNRFFDIERVRQMPPVRLFGNAVLSLMSKLSTGYWNIYDPTNGYTAIHADVARRLPFDKISRRYFFESDMLFRLNTLRAVVVDVPMYARYGNERSNLKIGRALGEFSVKHVRNFIKRIFYNYYLRDMSLASLELPAGIALTAFGLAFGAYHWIGAEAAGRTTAAGTVMLAALPVLLGMQLILSFIGHDVRSVPTKILHRQRLFYGANRSRAHLHAE